MNRVASISLTAAAEAAPQQTTRVTFTIVCPPGPPAGR